MTVLDATNKLFDWFSDNDSFCLIEDWTSLIIISEHKERDETAVKLALSNLEETGLIKSLDTKNKEKKYWILCKPFDQWEQSVSLTGPTSRGVSEVLNLFCDMIEDQSDRCDSSAISEKDIRNILIVSNYYKNLAIKKSEEND